MRTRPRPPADNCIALSRPTTGRPPDTAGTPPLRARRTPGRGGDRAFETSGAAPRRRSQAPAQPLTPVLTEGRAPRLRPAGPFARPDTDPGRGPAQQAQQARQNSRGKRGNRGNRDRTPSHKPLTCTRTRKAAVIHVTRQFVIDGTTIRGAQRSNPPKPRAPSGAVGGPALGGGRRSSPFRQPCPEPFRLRPARLTSSAAPRGSPGTAASARRRRPPGPPGTSARPAGGAGTAPPARVAGRSPPCWASTTWPARPGR
ncbi:hypothetical protein SUDANB70_02388 [Streptomyces sp. enrichment culture]